MEWCFACEGLGDVFSAHHRWRWWWGHLFSLCNIGWPLTKTFPPDLPVRWRLPVMDLSVAMLLPVMVAPEGWGARDGVTRTPLSMFLLPTPPWQDILWIVAHQQMHILLFLHSKNTSKDGHAFQRFPHVLFQIFLAIPLLTVLLTYTCCDRMEVPVI